MPGWDTLLNKGLIIEVVHFSSTCILWHVFTYEMHMHAWTPRCTYDEKCFFLMLPFELRNGTQWRLFILPLALLWDEVFGRKKKGEGWFLSVWLWQREEYDAFWPEPTYSIGTLNMKTDFCCNFSGIAFWVCLTADLIWFLNLFFTCENFMESLCDCDIDRGKIWKKEELRFEHLVIQGKIESWEIMSWLCVWELMGANTCERK